MATEIERRSADTAKREAVTKVATAIEGIVSDEDKARVLASVAILFGVDGNLLEALGQ